jgi:predicted nucleic acid-binding protein
MARSPKRRRRIYWDSCAWIALIGDEKLPFPDGSVENRDALCRAVIDEAAKGGASIFTSAPALAEVNKQPAGTPPDLDKIRDFFENEYIIIIQLDRRLGVLSRDLMQKGYSKLKPLDAVHLASAAVSNADEMHTFDAALLSLDGKVTKVDGTLLKICKPSLGGPSLPLLDSEDPPDGADVMGEHSAEDSDEDAARTPPRGGDPSIPGSGEGVG